MGTYIVLMGLPGAGKGTQAHRLEEHFELPHITSGGLFRGIAEQDTDLGRKVNHYMEAGNLVPDDVTVEVVRERLSWEDAGDGAILDGFPRTVPQAEALQTILAEKGEQVDKVPFISISDQEALERLSGRWISSGDPDIVYHMKYNPPKVPGVCDVTGEPLYQREDDTPEVQQHRIEVYHKQTQPLLAYYRDKGLLVEIDGEQGIEGVFNDLVQAIEGVK